MSYEKIFEPLRLPNGFTKNRIWTAPTLSSFCTAEGYATESTAKFYGERAAGGAGTVTIGETAIDWKYGKSHGDQLNIWGSEAATALANVVDRIHYGGARANIELCHGGLWSYPEFTEEPNPIGPSDWTREDGVEVKAMTLEQMEYVADKYAEACAIMIKCGFDSVMIHAAHGWLLGAFISRFDNRRTDEYGGSMENRARFPLMVLKRIRETVGDKLAIGLRFSVSEGEDPRAITPDEAVEFLKLAEPYIDVIHQSYGTRRDSSTRDRSNGGQFYEYAYNVKYCRYLKEHGITKPVVGVGSWDNPDTIEEALEKGWVDGVAMAKGIIADPELPNKILDERPEDIIPCLKCLKCFANGTRSNADKVPRFSNFSTNRNHCSVNPNYGRQNFEKITKAKNPKKVVIVGGGPAGLRAAIEAEKLGHSVTLIEKTDRLGGIINYSDYVSYKQFVKKYRDYLVSHVINNLNIKVVYNTEGTKEVVSSYKPDSLIIAFGGKKRPVTIPGADGKNVFDVEDIYGHEDTLGGKVVIVGGNESGVEAAIHLLEKGLEVSIIASRSRIVPETDYTARLPLVYRVEGKADIKVDSRVTKISENEVTVHNKETGADSIVEADSVVFAIGSDNQIDLALTYAGIARDFHVIGDALLVSDLENATKTAYDAAIRI